MSPFEKATFPNFSPSRNRALLKSFIFEDLGNYALIIKSEFMDFPQFHTLQGILHVFLGSDFVTGAPSEVGK